MTLKKLQKNRFKTDGIETPDIITGGFPCQPFSVAGKQKGTSDREDISGLRCFADHQRHCKPRFVIGENVQGIVNIQDGVVFETVCTDLESEGYEVRTVQYSSCRCRRSPQKRKNLDHSIASLENSRRTLQQGTELREKNEDEVREGYANQHQRSSSSSESNVANT